MQSNNIVLCYTQFLLFMICHVIRNNISLVELRNLSSSSQLPHQHWKVTGEHLSPIPALGCCISQQVCNHRLFHLQQGLSQIPICLKQNSFILSVFKFSFPKVPTLVKHQSCRVKIISLQSVRKIKKTQMYFEICVPGSEFPQCVAGALDDNYMSPCVLS